MSLDALWTGVEQIPIAREIRATGQLFPWIESVHVLAICTVVGSIGIMDLRLLGVGHMQTPFSQVQRRLFPWQMFAMVFSSATGLALVWGNPLNYVANIIFWVKMLAMAVAGLNALAFHFITEYTLVDWDSGQTPPSAAKLAGWLSIFLWANVILSGRLIPYAITWFRS